MSKPVTVYLVRRHSLEDGGPTTILGVGANQEAATTIINSDLDHMVSLGVGASREECSLQYMYHIMAMDIVE